MNIPHYHEVLMACSDLIWLDVVAFFNVCLCLTVVSVSVLLCVSVSVSCLSVWIRLSWVESLCVYISVCACVCFVCVCVYFSVYVSVICLCLCLSIFLCVYVCICDPVFDCVSATKPATWRLFPKKENSFKLYTASQINYFVVIRGWNQNYLKPILLLREEKTLSSDIKSPISL